MSNELLASSDLRLDGKASDHIWIMADGDDPHVIGIRMDCGDSGTVYVTREQAVDLAAQLTAIVDELKALAQVSPDS
jgi:hypothetical protein